MAMQRELPAELEALIGTLGLEDLESRARRANGGRPLPLRQWVGLVEAWRIAQALRETRGNRSAAARVLGIGRRTLYAKMEKLGLTPIWLVARPGASVTPPPHGPPDLDRVVA